MSQKIIGPKVARLLSKTNYDTPLKFNSKRPLKIGKALPQRKLIFQLPSFFRGVCCSICGICISKSHNLWCPQNLLNYIGSKVIGLHPPQKISRWTYWQRENIWKYHIQEGLVTSKTRPQHIFCLVKRCYGFKNVTRFIGKKTHPHRFATYNMMNSFHKIGDLSRAVFDSRSFEVTWFTRFQVSRFHTKKPTSRIARYLPSGKLT